MIRESAGKKARVYRPTGGVRVREYKCLYKVIYIGS